jgi:hypothetical protein
MENHARYAAPKRDLSGNLNIPAVQPIIKGWQNPEDVQDDLVRLE